MAALTAKGVTPTSNSIEDIITAINSITVGGDVKHTFKIQMFGSEDGWYYRTWIDGVYKGESGWINGAMVYQITL